MDEDQKHVEPTHREHLAPGVVVEPLVRESIQNSLDATVKDQPTRLSFTLGHADPDEAGPYFDGLRPHLDAITRSLPEGVPAWLQPALRTRKRKVRAREARGSESTCRDSTLLKILYVVGIDLHGNVAKIRIIKTDLVLGEIICKPYAPPCVA